MRIWLSIAWLIVSLVTITIGILQTDPLTMILFSCGGTLSLIAATWFNGLGLDDWD
jgi:hypothetical protein